MRPDQGPQRTRSAGIVARSTAPAVAAGAAGYLTKNVPAVQVLDAIRRTHAGEGLFSLGGGR